MTADDRTLELPVIHPPATAPASGEPAAPSSGGPVGTSTADAAAGPARRRGVRGPATVRTKLMAVLLSLSALGLGAAGATTYALQRTAAEARIDLSLTRTVDQFDPSAAAVTGETTRLALERALQQTIALPNGGALAFVDGRLEWYAPVTALRPEDDLQLITALQGASPSEARLWTIVTNLRTYRVATVPVRVEEDPASGMYVVVIDRGAELRALGATWRTYALVAGAALLVLGVAGWLLLGRVLRPLDHLRATAHRIHDTDLTGRIPVTGSDDIAELTRTVNAMLDRLQAAFTGQRRLLDDVGHELRTPLTVIGGHLELMDVADPADVSATRDLALDEVERMRGLVDDLLVLARTERPDFVRPRPTRIGVLTDDVLDKARALGDRAWRVAARAEVECEVDPVRLTQAWLQLAANAVAYSAQGTQVAIGSAVEGARLRLWVQDEGSGIAPEEVDRVFERFARGRNAPGAGAPGAGLGLAIVSAIAEGHHGHVDLASVPGVGTTVALDLPVRPVAGVVRPAPAEEVP